MIALVFIYPLVILALLQAVPTPPDIPTPPDVVGTILNLIGTHQWVALVWLGASLVIGLLVRILKGDSTLPLPAIPPNVRIWVAYGLGVVGSIAFKVFSGTPLSTALVWGISAAFAAIIGHETIIESLRGGKELHVPWLTKKLPEPIKPS